jgi:hypothetical protein
LHPHLLELAYGNVEVFERLGAPFTVVLQHELGELQAREGALWAEADPAAYL